MVRDGVSQPNVSAASRRRAVWWSTIALATVSTMSALAACGSEGAVSSEPAEQTAPPFSVASPATTVPPTSTAPSDSIDIVPDDSVDVPVETTVPPQTTGVPGPDSTFLATTVADPNAHVGDPPTAPVVLDQQERCRIPEARGFVGGDPQPMLNESTRLEPMLGAVVNYGGQHPDEFGGYGLSWLGAADGSVFAMFTDHVAEHRAALNAIVPFPDELYVCQAALSEASSRGLQALLLEEFNGRFQALSASYGSVQIGLQADQEAAAADLVARYGDAVRVRVGNLPYPLADDEMAAAACDVNVAGPTEIAGGVTATVSLPNPLPNTGATIEGTVTVVNDSDVEFSFNTGILRGIIVEADTFQAVAVYNGAVDAIGLGGTLQPGESRELPMYVSTASCDPDLGYTLPPGEYDLVVPVITDYGPNPGDPSSNALIVRTRIEVAGT